MCFSCGPWAYGIMESIIFVTDVMSNTCKLLLWVKIIDLCKDGDASCHLCKLNFLKIVMYSFNSNSVGMKNYIDCRFFYNCKNTKLIFNKKGPKYYHTHLENCLFVWLWKCCEELLFSQQTWNLIQGEIPVSLNLSICHNNKTFICRWQYLKHKS